MKILITRPEPKASALKTLCLNAGFDADVIPLFTIEPISPSLWQRELASLNAIDSIVFVSPHAAEYFMEQPDLEKYKTMPCFAIGASTAAVLKAHGFINVYTPQEENSEGLLSLTELHHVSTQTILIVRGSTGRELIHNTLIERGANTHYLAVYQNTRRPLNQEELSKLNQPYDLIVLTSFDALRYFLELNHHITAIITVMRGQMEALASSKQLRSLLLPSFSNEHIIQYLRKLYPDPLQ